MEECESLDSEMTELRGFQHGSSETMSQDDEDEVEELQNSLREVVQDQSVKPKLQCLMVDPSFSMVTVQSEDSGIVWETASSRCSTPWASETSSVSEAYSMEGSGTAGKITIVFDEDKVVRRRTRSGGRSSRLGDRLSRPGSSRSASALGVERLEMAEVSVPNIKPQKSESEPDLEGIKNKDQQLFSLISEGYEILNIRVPSKLPTVDEEESTELQDNLSYLDQTPKIRSRNQQDWTHQQNHVTPGGDTAPDQQKGSEGDSPQLETQPELRRTPTPKDDIDYFEKFTLVDVVGPGEPAPELLDQEEQLPVKAQSEEQEPATSPEDASAPESSFVMVSDEDLVGEHLDEVFYKKEVSPDGLQQRDLHTEGEAAAMRMRRESQKESGSVLFGSEETVLTPIFISPGPPKIIDPILLEEPTAMSFMYSDLYEDAVGERRKSDEEHSEAESAATQMTYKRRLSDSEEADGYLEKFTLKDETPTVEVRPETPEDRTDGRMMWSQSKFEMTGCLTRVISEGDEEKTTIKEEPKTRESVAVETSQEIKSEIVETKREKVLEKVKGEDEKEHSAQTEKMSSGKESKLQHQEIEGEVKKEETEAEESSTAETPPAAELVDCKEDQGEPSAECEVTEGDQFSQTQDVKGPAVAGTAESTVTTASAEVSCIGQPPTAASEFTEELPDEAASDSSTHAANKKPATEAQNESKEAQVDTQGTIVRVETETLEKTHLEDVERGSDVVPDIDASVEVIADCDGSVHALVEVSEKAVGEKEIQTQIEIDLQEAKPLEAEAAGEAAVLEGQRRDLVEPTTAEGLADKPLPEAEQGSGERAAAEDIKPEVQEEVDTGTNSTQHELEAQMFPPEGRVVEVAATDVKPTSEQTSTTGIDNDVQETVKDELIVLVPKGQSVEMDIAMSQRSEKTTIETRAPPQVQSTFKDLTEAQTSTRMEFEQEPNSETRLDPQLGVTDDILPKEPSHEACSEHLPEREDDKEEQKAERESEKDQAFFPPLRSFSAQEDLSAPDAVEVQLDGPDVEEKAAVEIEDVAAETTSQDTEQKESKAKEVPEAPEVMVEEPEYEVIYERDAIEKSTPASEEEEEKIEMVMEEEEERAPGPSAEDELIEADYDIIGAEEERQARLAAELQGMDWFCLTCGSLLAEGDRASGEHDGHQVASVDSAYEEIKVRFYTFYTQGCIGSAGGQIPAGTSAEAGLHPGEVDKLSDWISELQGRSENIEDLVSELELAYNTVEDHCVETEAVMQTQNEEMMALVMEQYNNMSVSMEEEKKAKLEQLYDQIVSFQDSIDSAKATLETTAREAETEARSPDDIHARLEAALESALSLELGPRGLLVFEDYAKGNTSAAHLTQRKGIPVPQSPTLQPQEAGSATSTSVTVYWRVSSGDIVDCFQVYCMEDPQGVVSEEYRVTVKESYCVLEDLEPDKTYKVWVMAVNYTGCSLPSERLSFTTAPSVPVIDTEHCTVTWDTATLRWGSTRQEPGLSYTLEYCRQYEVEGEGLRSISGIKSCEQKVFLQPCENYLFYIKAVNAAGASDQSEAALISTKGTKFRLLGASAHSALEVSEDQTALHYPPSSRGNTASTDRQCPSVLGELLPPLGVHYWEAVVSGSTAYRLGVTCSVADRSSPVGENNLSWCLQCVPAPSGCRYQLLHRNVRSSVFVTEVPERVGTLLDYQRGRLAFYNARSGQLLGSFGQDLTGPCHPVLALEMAGSLAISMVPEVPEFTRGT